MSHPEFSSEVEFRAAFDRVLHSGATSAESNEVIHIDWMDTRVGPLVLGATADAICLLEFSDRRRLETQLRTLQRQFAMPLVSGSNEVLTALRRQLDEYLAATRKTFDLPLDYRGTPFQKKVWEALLEIPYGDTWSYKQLAERVADATASRAVGTANGMNRIAIIIPCHRVVNTGGGLGGYGGGLLRKQFLLDLERGQLQFIA